MKTISKWLLAGSTLVAGSMCQATDGLPRFDHYDPVVLNEYALDKLGKGDVGTASILLERAVLLAPYDIRIRHNLEILRATQAGIRLGTPAPSNAAPPVIVEPRAAEAPMPPVPYWKNGNAP